MAMYKGSTKTMGILVNQINNLTGWTCDVETWSPGDGWTRYRLMQGHKKVFVSYRTREQFFATLEGVLDVLRMLNRDDQFLSVADQHDNDSIRYWLTDLCSLPNKKRPNYVWENAQAALDGKAF